MSDVMPNLSLGRARLELQREELKLNLFRQNVRLIEMADEEERIRANMEATEKSIVEITAALSKVESKSE